MKKEPKKKKLKNHYELLTVLEKHSLSKLEKYYNLREEEALTLK